MLLPETAGGTGPDGLQHWKCTAISSVTAPTTLGSTVVMASRVAGVVAEPVVIHFHVNAVMRKIQPQLKSGGRNSFDH